MNDERLPPCRFSPSCVSSDADPRDSHYIDPFQLSASSEGAWAALLELLEITPRVRIVERSEWQIQAEFEIAIIGFVDDVEFQLRPDDGIIAVRSASRLGNYDFGVNRRRVEGIRKQLHARGVVTGK